MVPGLTPGQQLSDSSAGIDALRTTYFGPSDADSSARHEIANSAAVLFQEFGGERFTT
jgi:hypothetical protein